MSLRERIEAEIERRETIVNSATSGPWNNDDPMASDGVFAPAVDGFVADGDYARMGPFAVHNATHIALHDPVDALGRYAHYRKVLERHRSNTDLESQRKFWECVTCSHEIECNSDRYRDHDIAVPWPCAEIADLAEALGLSTEDES